MGWLTMGSAGRHRDYGRHNSGPQWQWPYDHPSLSEDVKLFVMINDQDPDQGNTAVVYGSHQQLNGPDSVGEWRPEERGKSLGQDPHEMPGHVQFTGKAGDGKVDRSRSACSRLANAHESVAISALLFDIRSYHVSAALQPLSSPSQTSKQRLATVRNAEPDGGPQARGSHRPLLPLQPQ